MNVHSSYYRSVYFHFSCILSFPSLSTFPSLSSVPNILESCIVHSKDEFRKMRNEDYKSSRISLTQDLSFPPVEILSLTQPCPHSSSSSPLLHSYHVQHLSNSCFLLEMLREEVETCAFNFYVKQHVEVI